MSRPEVEVQKVLDLFRGDRDEYRPYFCTKDDEYILTESLVEALQRCGLNSNEYFVDEVDCFENPGVTIKAVSCAWLWDGVVNGMLIRTMIL